MDIYTELEKAEYIVAGVGDRFSYNWELVQSDDRYSELVDYIDKDKSLEWLIPFLQKVSMDANPDMRLYKAYKKLCELIRDKDAYVITTTIDDYVYDSAIPFDRIVTPCGGFRQLQCEDKCTEELTNLPFALLQYVQKLYNKTISVDEIRDKYPECPHCGKNLIFNQVGCDHFCESGYQKGWSEYQAWIEKTMNKEVVMLELGAGLGFMSVFRRPFEKIAAYNRKASLFRVHPTLYMGTPEIKERCTSIACEPIDWVLDLK